MKKYIIILAAAVCALCACQKHEIELLDKPIIEQIDANTYTYTFSAVISDNVSEVEEDGTKATVSRAGAFAWAVDDELKFFKSDNTSASAKITAVDGSTATITVYDVDSRADFVTAIYPASAAVSNNQISFNARGPIVVADIAGGGTLTFHHIGSVINLKFYGIAGMDDIKSLVFEPTTPFGYDGSFTFNASHEPSLSPSVTTTSKIVVPASKADNNEDITVVVPSVILSGFSAALNNKADGTGRNLFKKSTATEHDLATKRPVLMNMKKVAFETAKIFYVRTETTESKTYDGDQILLQTGTNTFEVWQNCDKNTISYIYDEYNVGNDVTSAGCLTYTAQVNDPNKYKISYNSSTNTASMTYISAQYSEPYGWSGVYSGLYLRGSFDGSNWTNSGLSGSNHVFTGTLTTTATTGNFGVKGWEDDNKWWTADTDSGYYTDITAGDSGRGIYYAGFVTNAYAHGGFHNQALTNLPVGTYSVYINITYDTYNEKPIHLMFVKQ